MKKWKIKKIAESPDESLTEKFNPIILNLLAVRGIYKPEEIEKYFNTDYGALSDPFAITGMEKITGRIMEAKKKKEKIAVYGDYDADGVTAAGILFETLKNLGFPDVVCYIPDRQQEGYGMNENALDYLSKKNVKLIITVDCGITNCEEALAAGKMGIDVIITDHHHLARNIPSALAIIDPHLPDSGFSGSNLSGVGVAFKLAQALFEKINPEKKEQLKWMLDLVAIGTIADCVPLTGENRTLVKYGLIVISKTRRVGLLEIFRVGRVEISENNIPDAHKVAFQIAPRINAAGRMDHASIAFNLLMENDPVSARQMALELESKNQERQKITAEIVREVKILAENAFKNKKLIFAVNPHWPVGVLGLVAGKITEEFRKPTAVLQEQEGLFTGSFRSIPEINIIEIIKQCSDLLIKFGGHSQAAGVSVSKENFSKFYDKISAEIEKRFEGKEIIPTIDVDCEIAAGDINPSFMADIKRMEPFGIGNPEPVFICRNMSVSDIRIVGNGSKHLKLALKNEKGGPKIFDAIGFSLAEKFPNLKINDKIDIVFNLCEDEWNGNKKMQLKLIDLCYSLENKI